MFTLSPYQDADLNWLNIWLNNPDLALLWTGREVKLPLTVRQMKEFHSSSDVVTPLIIQLKGSPVGYLETHLKEKRSIHLARLLVGESKYRGQGIMQKVLEGLIKELFSTTPTKRITLNVFADNPGALNCYLKAGFTEYNRKDNYQGCGKTMIAMQRYKPILGLY